MTLIEAILRFKVLNFELADKWVRYNESILGSVGIELSAFLTQNAEKSLKSAL